MLPVQTVPFECKQEKPRIETGSRTLDLTCLVRQSRGRNSAKCCSSTSQSMTMNSSWNPETSLTSPRRWLWNLLTQVSNLSVFLGCECDVTPLTGSVEPVGTCGWTAISCVIPTIVGNSCFPPDGIFDFFFFLSCPLFHDKNTGSDIYIFFCLGWRGLVEGHLKRQIRTISIQLCQRAGGFRRGRRVHWHGARWNR